MQVKTDLLDKIPKIGDLVVFNPPKYKGIVSGIIKSFTSGGRPKVELTTPPEAYESYEPMSREIREKGVYSIKTDFVIVKNEL